MWPFRSYDRDTLLGLAKGTLVVVYRKRVLFYSHILGINLYDFIVDQLIWFESAKPAGIKLHIGLSQALSQVGLGYTEAVRKIVIYLGERGIFDVYLLCLGVIFFAAGSRRGHACLRETLNVVLAPVSVPAMFAQWLVRTHVLLSRILWRAMRGTSYPSILEHLDIGLGKDREDVIVSSLYHITLACLLFVPLILTLPTVAWYSIFVCILNGLIQRSIYGCLELISF